MLRGYIDGAFHVTLGGFTLEHIPKLCAGIMRIGAGFIVFLIRIFLWTQQLPGKGFDRLDGIGQMRGKLLWNGDFFVCFRIIDIRSFAAVV